MFHSTIAAVSTPPGRSGVGMIRLSGENALSIADRIIRPVTEGRGAASLKGYTGLLGRAFDETGDIDDVVLFVYRAPKSYTGEHVAEICCHGGTVPLQRILRQAFQLGARPAEPGEFTRRAVLSGKLTLEQAEAVNCLISAEGRQAASLALAAKDGAVSREISSIRKLLTETASLLAASLDYPEEQGDADLQRLKSLLLRAEDQLETLLRDYERGKLIRLGIETAIVGKPNVGKSTLMNLLSGEERSIVTEIPGTTRDIVENRVSVGDVILNLSDTAGLRDASDPVEAIGVRRARERLDGAQLILAVFDGASALQREDWALLEQISGRPSIAVLNKMDAGQQIHEPEIAPYVRRVVWVSARTGEGRDILEKAVREVLDLDGLDPGQAVLCSERQRACALSALEEVREAACALRTGITEDAVSVCVDGALDALMRLTGERVSETVIEEVFSNFCVGK